MPSPPIGRCEKRRSRLPERRILPVLFQADLILVAFREDRIVERPLDADVWIVSHDAAFGVWSIEGRLLVLDLANIGEGCKAMSKSYRHEQLRLIFRGEFDPEGSSERRRTHAQIDGHVQNPADSATHQFRHGRTHILVMKAAKHAAT